MEDMFEETVQHDTESKKSKKMKAADAEKVMVSKFMNPTFMADFIETYRNAPCLWQVSSKEYHNKQKRDLAMQELLEFTKNTIPDATIGFIKKRIENIRSSFRRELGKVQASMTSGVGTENVYSPKLWYFDLMEFTVVHELPKKSKSTLPSTVANEDMSIQEDEDLDEQTSKAQQSEVTVSTPTSTITRKPAEGPPGPPMTKKPRPRIADLENQRENLIQTALSAMQKQEDEFDAVGKSVAAKLRKMNDIQKVHAEKLVNDIVYKGLLNKLTEHTCISENASSNFNFMSTPTGSSTSNTSGNAANRYYGNAMQYNNDNSTFTTLSSVSSDYTYP